MLFEYIQIPQDLVAIPPQHGKNSPRNGRDMESDFETSLTWDRGFRYEYLVVGEVKDLETSVVCGNQVEEGV